MALKTAAGGLHKTEQDGVRLDLRASDPLAAAYRDFEARLGPEVLVQEMAPDGAELILGVVNDPQFGPMLTLGTGGIFVEVLKDVRMLRLPTTPDAVREALSGLRGAALLRGARGLAPADEIDVNPLVALPDRAVVVVALIVPKRGAGEPEGRAASRRRAKSN